MRSRSPRQPNSRLKKVSRICSCPRAPLGHPHSRFHGVPARGVTSTGGASSKVPTGCDGSPVKWSASPQSANAVFHATDRPSGSCRLRRTSCCKAVKGANNLNKEPSAAQKMLSVKARVGALYSGSFHASQFPRRTLLGNPDVRKGPVYCSPTQRCSLGVILAALGARDERPENVRGESPKVYALGIAYTLPRPQYVAQVLYDTP